MAVTKHSGRLVVLRGQRNPVGAKTRTCPKCEAKPGWSCGRWIKQGDGRYWRSMTTFHKEREKPV